MSQSIKESAEKEIKRHYQRWKGAKITEFIKRLEEWTERHQPTEVFIGDFWHRQKDIFYYRGLEVYLCEKFPEFLIAYTRALQHEVLLLQKKGLQPKVNPTFLEFLLINLADYKPRSYRNYTDKSTKTQNNNLPTININQPEQKQPKQIDQGGEQDELLAKFLDVKLDQSLPATDKKDDKKVE